MEVNNQKSIKGLFPSNVNGNLRKFAMHAT